MSGEKKKRVLPNWMLPGSALAVAPKCDKFTKIVSRPQGGAKLVPNIKVEDGEDCGRTAMVEKEENSRSEKNERKHAYYIMSPAELSEVCDHVMGTVM